MTEGEQHEFWLALTLLRHELIKVSANVREYVMFGSASLVVRGVIDRAPGDIDMFVSKRVWGRLLDRRIWGWSTPDAGSPPILTTKVLDREINLFFDWYDPWLSIDVRQLLAEGWDPGSSNLVRYQGDAWPCVSLQEAKRHKQEAIRYPLNSKKALHQSDIAAIEKALEVG